MTENSQLIEKLRSLITDGDEVDRCYAIRTLQTIQDTSSTELLIEAMRDDDIDVSVDAIAVLGEQGGEQVTEKIIESLINDPDGEIKVACVRALASLKDDKAAFELLKLAEKPPEETSYASGDWDFWWDMQLAAIRGLGEIQEVKAIPVLKRILEEDDCLDIESEIFNSLAKIGNDEAGSKANEYLFKQMSKGSSRTRRRIAKALGNSRTSATVKPLARGLQDKSADVREATLLALQERAATQYLPAVLLTFRDSNAKVRKTAIEVAHQFALKLQDTESTDDRLLEKLLPLLQDSDPHVKSAVLDTLIKLDWKADKESKEYLSTLLKECTGDCFASVCRAINAQQLSDGVATLLYMFRHKELHSSEEEIHALATIGLSKQWNTVIESTLGVSIFNDEKMVRLAALEALSTLDKSFPHDSKVEDRLPLDMITEALQGQLKPPITQKIIPIVPVDDVAQKFEAESAKKEADSKGLGEDTLSVKDSSPIEETSFVDNALEKISQSIADGEKPHPLSTLDAIAISSVEKKLEAQADQESEKLEGDIPNDIEKDEELERFVALSEENKEVSKWLFNRETVDVSIDIQRLAARMLGKVGGSNAFPILLKAFEKNDSQLKCEAALSIGALIEKNIQPEDALKPILHKTIIKELDADERDLRIAVARALGELGESADIPFLIEKLQDDSVAMRIEAVHSLSKIAMREDSNESNSNKTDYHELAERILEQLDSNQKGVQRAVVAALIPLFENKLNGSAVSLKQTAINSLINAGLTGAHGQVKEMSWGLNALDKDLSSTRLLEKMDEVTNSVERRFVVEMLGELHRPV